jgi:hypothetical protein
VKEVFDLLHESLQSLLGFAVLCLAVLGYFLKVYAEKRLEGLAERIEEIAKTSLEIKKDMRTEERGELVDFRVSVEKWQYFLETAVFDFTVKSPSEAKVADLYDEDKKLFLAVRIATVKACIYLQSKELEQELMTTIIKIRQICYPLINKTLPKLIDAQAQLRPIEDKLSRFVQSGGQDMSSAPTKEDRDENLRVQTMATEEIRKFSEDLIAQYRVIAMELNGLKEMMNQYIYRPLTKAEIDKVSL